MKIAIEGPDYSGKTTVADILEIAYQYPRFSQPGVDFLRNLISSEFEDYKPSEEILALAFSLDRTIQDKYMTRDHDVFITDRSVLSSLIMQGEKIGHKKVKQINQFVDYPDVVFYLKIDEKELEKRVISRGEGDYYDKKAHKMLKLYDEYMKGLIEKGVDNLFVIDARDRTSRDIAEEIHQKIEEVLS